jgi:hypothetical protein
VLAVACVGDTAVDVDQNIAPVRAPFKSLRRPQPRRRVTGPKATATC